MEKIVENLTSPGASAANIQSRTTDSSSEDDEEALPKKVDDLIDIVGKLRKEIAELRAEQTSIEVTIMSLIKKDLKLINSTFLDNQQKLGDTHRESC